MDVAAAVGDETGSGTVETSSGDSQAEEVAMTVAEELRAEGEAKGRAQGRVEGRAEVLEKQMVLKFGSLSVEHAAFIDRATEQQLDVYIERILTATSAAAVFADH